MTPLSEKRELKMEFFELRKENHNEQLNLLISRLWNKYSSGEK